MEPAKDIFVNFFDNIRESCFPTAEPVEVGSCNQGDLISILELTRHRIIYSGHFLIFNFLRLLLRAQRNIFIFSPCCWCLFNSINQMWFANL